MGRACRSIVNRGCRRCTERINTQNKEEMGATVERNYTWGNGMLWVGAEIHRRGIIQRIKIRCRA
jgi:hypothetical protein